MKKKLLRIISIVVGLLSTLPWLVLIAGSLYTLSLPDSEAYFEAKSYASSFLMDFAFPTAVSVLGFAGSLLAHRYHRLGGVLMMTCGAVLLIFGDWYLRIAPVLLIIAGVFYIISRPEGDSPYDSHGDDRGEAP